MAATINITGSGAPLNFAPGATVTVEALPNTGATYLWEFIDKPEGSVADFADNTAQQTTFDADLEGSYLIRVTIDGLSVGQAIAAVPVVTSLGSIRIPAAGETFEADSLKGWARAIQNGLLILSNAVASVVGLSWKAPARVSATGDEPLSGSTPYSIDTIPLSDGDRVLLRFQTAGEENGIYDFNDDGAGSYTLGRSVDADDGAKLSGAVVTVLEGAVNADKTFQQVAEVVAIDVDPVVWNALGGSLSVPSGTVELAIDGGERVLRWNDGGTDYEVELTPNP